MRWVIWVGVRFWREPAGWNLKRARWRPTYCCSAMSGMKDLDPKGHQCHLHLRQMRYHVHSFSSCLTQLNRHFFGGKLVGTLMNCPLVNPKLQGNPLGNHPISQGQAGPATKKPKIQRAIGAFSEKVQASEKLLKLLRWCMVAGQNVSFSRYSMCIYIYVCVCACVRACIYIYIYVYWISYLSLSLSLSPPTTLAGLPENSSPEEGGILLRQAFCTALR